MNWKAILVGALATVLGMVIWNMLQKQGIFTSGLEMNPYDALEDENDCGCNGNTKSVAA